MGYIDPSDPIFGYAAPASGAGIHTDEASSALTDLRRDLEQRTVRTLASGLDLGTRSNPKEEVIVPQKELFPLAFLVTGMWGPDPPNNLRAFEASLGRRSLPKLRENPYDPRSHDRFFDRMRRLLSELDQLSERIAQRYGRKAAGKSQPWATAVARMRRAVAYVLSQEGAKTPSIFSPDGLLGMRPGTWQPLAAQGNKKLPFVAYSELPMATCPGAGACGVRFDYFEEAARPTPGKKKVQRKKGWCYSFKAFRYPDAFARQFMNTLANYSDREFAVILGGGASLHPDDYAGRVQASLRGGEEAQGRLWPQYIKGLALTLTRKSRSAGSVAFMRLFVDGDINYEDNIVAWMEAVAQMGPGGDSLRGSVGHVKVYGYTKCWQQFVNVDRWIGGRWPVNYTVNLSSGSVYFSAKYAAVRSAVEKLPIARGYFEAISLQEYLPQLEKQTALYASNPNAVVPMPPQHVMPFAFDPERVKAFLRLNAIRSVEDLLRMDPSAPIPRDGKGRAKNLTEAQVRHLAYDLYLNRLIADPTFGSLVRKELRKDKDPDSEPAFLSAYEEEQKAVLQKALAGGGASSEAFTAKALHDKALALTLHEVLWSLGIGGSCPLVCGNCSDNPVDPALGVHRCASETTFKGRTIHIGLH